jgi:DNA-binding transcriptional MerR regulator
MSYRIGEFARLAGVSIKTLRFYDEVGLLKPASVDARTQYRRYESRQLERLTTILALKDLGATLADIRRVISTNEPESHRRRLLERLRAEALDTLGAVGRSLQWIDAELDEATGTPREVRVALRSRQAMRIASVRARAPSYFDIEELDREFRDGLDPGFSGELRGILWHCCAAGGTIEGEPFVQVDGRARSCGAYAVRELPGATVATAYCESTDDDAARVYDAVDRWMHARHLKLAGAKREICRGQILEVQFPVS